MPRNIFITGGTGYIGSRLIPLLTSRGNTVHALVRPGSETKLNASVTAIAGDALNQESFATKVFPSDTFIQLVGVPHPSPAKAEQCRQIDLFGASFHRRRRAREAFRLSQCRPPSANHEALH